MKEPIYKVSCIVIDSKCTVMRSTSQLVDIDITLHYIDQPASIVLRFPCSACINNAHGLYIGCQ